MRQQELFSHLNELSKQMTKAWIVTVISGDGSTPTQAGMKLVLHEDGSFLGTVGGGQVESLIMKRILSEQPASPVLWRYDVGAHIAEATTTQMICGGIITVFIEPLNHGTTVYIFGGGHCGIQLSEVASRAGFRVVVCDDREEWLTEEKHPLAVQRLLVDYSNLKEYITFDPHHYYVIMTYGHIADETVLRQLIQQPFTYLGMMGSTTKVATVKKSLLRDGFAKEQWDQVHAPIGIPIGSETPFEIAISITAELLQYKKRVQLTNS